MSHDGQPRDPSKRHRHDIGAVDHGPQMTEQVTHGIQIVLGLCLAATAGLVLYALAAAAGAA